LSPPPPQVSSLNSRKSILFTGALALIFAVFSLITCKPSPDEPNSGSPNTGNPNTGNGNTAVTGVSLNKTSLTLAVGGTETLTPTIQPASATNKNVSWASNNTAVATVNNGTVTAVAAGSATITVTTQDGGKTATCSVTVNAANPGNVAVIGVTLDQSTLTLTVGGNTATLTHTLNPTNATNKNVTWTSSNNSVATVNNGTVTAVATGSATITVTTQDGSHTATCSVTVNAASPGTVAVIGVTLSQSTLTLTVGGSAATLTHTLNPTNATNKNVTWTSSNESVATVNNGTVTVVAVGSAVITVTTQDGSHTATCSVTVNPVYGSTSITISFNGTTEDIVLEPENSDFDITDDSYYDASIPVLTDNVWYDDGDPVKEYQLYAQNGVSYAVAWNDSYQGNGTKSADIGVSAYWKDTNVSIFSRTDSGWNTPQNFTASRSGIVIILVEYYSGGSTNGTYALRYSTTGSTQSISDTVTFSAANGDQYSNFQWILDGVEQSETSGSITFNRIDLAVGPHRLTVIASRDGKVYSKEQKFTVSE
jgi:uncharacterized protein YjdB